MHHLGARPLYLCIFMKLIRLQLNDHIIGKNARIHLSVHETNYFIYFCLIKDNQNVVSIIERHRVGICAVFRLEIKEYARGGGFSPTV